MTKKQLKSTTGYRVGIYVRVSTEEQAENPEGSIKNQEERLREFIKLKNMVEPFGEVVRVYSDPGFSAKDMNRPGFKIMLKAIEAGDINLLLVTELSRFSRSTKDFAVLQEFLEEHDCKFLSIRENFDTSGAAGRMVMNLMASIAEFERRQTGERIANSFLARAKRGLHNGGPVPLGYMIDEARPGCLAIVAEEAELVRTVFKQFLKLKTLAETAKWFNEQGIKFPSRVRGGGIGRAKIVRIDALFRILRNKAYVGTRVFHTKAGVEEVKASWDSIIDDETFARANAMLSANCSRRQTHRNKFPFLLTGLLTCKQCGERMAGAAATSRAGHKVGYYEHTATRKNEASLRAKILEHKPRRIPSAKIEPLVWQEVKRFLLEEGFATGLLERARHVHGALERETKLENLQAKVATLDRQISVLAERIAKLPEAVDPGPLIEKLGDLQAEQKRLSEERLRELKPESEADQPISFDSLDLFRKGLSDFIEKGERDPKIKSAIIKTIVHKIEILKDGFEIHFHVGETHFLASGANPDASFFMSMAQNKKPSAGLPTEGSIFISSAVAASRYHQVTGSRRLTIGGGNRDRTCDLKHAMLALSQLSYTPT